MSLAKRSKMKTEHGGAKNGGGYWGKRAEAKKISRKHRREKEKREIQLELLNVEPSQLKKKLRGAGVR